MKRVVAYAEFTAREIEKGKDKNFKRTIEEFIKQKYEIQNIVIEIKDRKCTENTKFNIICKDILQNKVDLLLLKNIKSLSTNIENIIDFSEKLKKLDVEIFFIEENVSTASKIGMTQLGMMLYFMEEMSKAQKRVMIRRKERQELSNNKSTEANTTLKNSIHTSIISEDTYNEVKERIAENNKKKEENKAKKIFGYDYKDGKYVINEEEAKVIRKRAKAVTNEIKSQKMKEKWQDENYRNQMIARMKMAKKIKREQRGNE